VGEFSKAPGTRESATLQPTAVVSLQQQNGFDDKEVEKE